MYRSELPRRLEGTTLHKVFQACLAKSREAEFPNSC